MIINILTNKKKKVYCAWLLYAPTLVSAKMAVASAEDCQDTPTHTAIATDASKEARKVIGAGFSVLKKMKELNVVCELWEIPLDYLTLRVVIFM